MANGRLHLSLDDQAQATLEEIESELDNVYGGKSQFFRSMLMNYDRKSRLQAEKKVKQERIESLQNQIKSLEREVAGIEQELEEVTADEEQSLDEGTNFERGTDEFWDKTVEMIFSRRTSKDPKSLEGRWNRFFQGRYEAFEHQFSETTPKDFKEMLLDEADERGFDTSEVDFL